MKKKILIVLFIVQLLSLFSYKEDVYFPNTDYELKVYHIEGKKPGKTLMIIGGMHGDEKSPYIAADIFVDSSLEKGNLIIVPRANLQSILSDTRLLDVDMNRRFQTSQPQNEIDKITEILKNLMQESDVVLNLHEGRGFYSPVKIDKERNPTKYGQSIIADADTFQMKDKKQIYLGDIARTITTNINKRIEDTGHYFNFWNHNTASKKTVHKEQKLSATFFALTELNIPAFGVEASSNIEDLNQRVKYLSIVINEFMNYYGIAPEYPAINLPKPKFDFILYQVNNKLEIAHADDSIKLNIGDSLQIISVKSNYSRGVISDILNYGTGNDFGVSLKISANTQITLKKDSVLLAAIPVQVLSAVEIGQPAISQPLTTYNFLGFNLFVNSQERKLMLNDTLRVARGDIIRLNSVIPENKKVIANVVGFYHGYVDSENDLHHYINTSDLLPKFALKKDLYQIYAELNEQKLGNAYLQVKEPEKKQAVEKKSNYKLTKLLLIYNDNEISLNPGDTLDVKEGDSVILTDALTNLPKKCIPKINFVGYITTYTKDGDDRNNLITINNKLISKYSVNKDGRIYEIKVNFKERSLGSVYVRLVE